MPIANARNLLGWASTNAPKWTVRRGTACFFLGALFGVLNVLGGQMLMDIRSNLHRAARVEGALRSRKRTLPQLQRCIDRPQFVNIQSARGWTNFGELVNPLYLAEVSTTAEETTGCLHLALSGLQSAFDLHGGAHPRQDKNPEFKNKM